MKTPELNSGQEFESVKNETIALLKQCGVPYENWGKGTSKTLEHLIREIIAGETILEVEGSGLVRKVSITFIDIFYIDNSGKRFLLTEEKQVFKDGRERKRDFEGSIAEKLKANEIPGQDAVQRAVEEELGIKDISPAQPKDTRETLEDSSSYPGLKMKAKKYHFEVGLSAEQYKPEGYIEHQSDKDTYFGWIEYRP